MIVRLIANVAPNAVLRPLALRLVILTCALLTMMASIGGTPAAQAAVGSAATALAEHPAVTQQRLKDALLQEVAVLPLGAAISPFMGEDADLMPVLYFKAPVEETTAPASTAPPEPVETLQWHFWDDPAFDARGSMAWPLKTYRLSSGFGYRWGRLHRGLDLTTPMGTPVHSARKGVVTFVGFKQGYGRTVLIRHGNGVVTKYAHLRSARVRVGQLVERTQVIGRVGMTGNTSGPHLHFEVLNHGVVKNPRGFLPA